jgi:hypothetical protein
MNETQLRVTYKAGEPQKVKFGCGLMGETVSLAHVKDKTAIIAFDKTGSTDFEKALLELPFIEEIHD